MAFRDFTFPGVATELGLTMHDGNLFPDPPAFAVRPDFTSMIMEGVELSTALETEKARSEFVIAPILMEARLKTGKRFKLFSGAEWSVEPERGLNGYCDFLLTWGPSQYFITPPFAAVVEAKKYEYHSGFGQCIAAMYAAGLANQRASLPLTAVHGAVTFGTGWKFLRLEGSNLTIDSSEFFVSDLPHLFGVLDLITRLPASMAA